VTQSTPSLDLPRAIAPAEPGDLIGAAGAAGAGKRSALRTVPPTQVVCLDHLRALVPDEFSARFSVLKMSRVAGGGGVEGKRRGGF
jgi:hypothetical protein